MHISSSYPPLPLVSRLTPAQVAFYMKTYDDAGIVANVGYEVGIPAYPAPDHDKSHQLPLTSSLLSSIISNTQPNHKGGFFWELFKPAVSACRVRL
jgi:hypothetical protein